VEYALLVSLIALVCLGAVHYFQTQVSASLSKSSSAIVNAGQ
jgi:Flp pilus assembly pilin Flp